jgi:methylmalonyl-CoA/ethylmalonyl-CoA epimerase
VANLEQALKFWRDALALELTRRATLEDQGVEACLLRSQDGEIELLQPLSPDNAVGRFLKRHGAGLHHVCFATDDISAELLAARAKGLRLIDQKPRKGLAGMICFLHPEAAGGVLVEYAQPATE